jgi:hypothetical protein
MQDTITCMADVQEKFGVTETSILNYVVSDGNHLIATRYVFPESANAASLYYAEGSSYRRQQEPEPLANGGSVPDDSAAAGQEEAPVSKSSALHDQSYCLEYGVSGSKVAFVASEPITDSSIDWVSLTLISPLALDIAHGNSNGLHPTCFLFHLHLTHGFIQVAVPKNTALIMAREKEYGHITILRFALLAGPSASRDLKNGGGAGSIVPLPHPSTHPCRLIVAECQREVILALEAIQVRVPSHSPEVRPFPLNCSLTLSLST